LTTSRLYIVQSVVQALIDVYRASSLGAIRSYTDMRRIAAVHTSRRLFELRRVCVGGNHSNVIDSDPDTSSGISEDWHRRAAKQFCGVVA